MALRSRLALYFIAIVVVPVIGAAVVVGFLVPREIDERTDERLRGASAAVVTLRAERLDAATRAVTGFARQIADLPAPAAASAPRTLERMRKELGLDFLRVDSLVVSRPSRFDPGLSAAIAPGVYGPGEGTLSATIRLSDGRVIAGGWFTDNAWAKHLSAVTGLGVGILADGRVIASSPFPDARHARQTMRTLRLSAGDDTVVLSAPRVSPGIVLALALGGIGAAALLLACACGMLLARALARPLVNLSCSAAAIAAGDYTQRVVTRGHDEVAVLGRTINAMSDSVQEYVSELQRSRDELRKTLERLGATLRSTRGMEEMLASVLEAAAAALGADAGALFRLGHDQTLQVEASFGLEAASATREAAARAVREGVPVLLPALGGEDPLGRVVAAAPLRRDGSPIGAIAIASAALPEPFDLQDLATLGSFAAQASVAIDNVFLREQAERQARTDPLTGTPNRRAMEEILVAELDRAQRFGRPVSVLMIDLDHFKRVNDQYGHGEGDQVLIEVVARIGSLVRSGIDVLARYGGEEFVLVLPETPPSGAMCVAHKILESMRTKGFATSGARVTVSIGVASVPGDGPGSSDVLHAADLALYQSKGAGRDRVTATPVVLQAELEAITL